MKEKKRKRKILKERNKEKEKQKEKNRKIKREKYKLIGFVSCYCKRRECSGLTSKHWTLKTSLRLASPEMWSQYPSTKDLITAKIASEAGWRQ